MTAVKKFSGVIFVNLCTASCHQNLHNIFLKHNPYQLGKFSFTNDKNTIHLFLLKSHRQGKQLRLLGSELDGITSNFLEYCYMASTRKPYGHILYDLTPSCPFIMLFRTNIASENLSLLKKKATAKQNSLNINLFANLLSPDSQTLFFVQKCCADPVRRVYLELNAPHWLTPFLKNVWFWVIQNL